MIDSSSNHEKHRLQIAAIALLFLSVTTFTVLAQGSAKSTTPFTSAEVWVDDILEDSGAQNSVVHNTKTWTNGIVPYVFSSGLDTTQREQIIAAMDEWAGAAYLRFVPRDGHSNYLTFIEPENAPPGLCGSSHVGMKGGYQPVFISCFNHDTILHEIGHALGLYHEHQRADRDNYVDILWENIRDDREHNFAIRDSALLATPYDFESIMHYHWQAFSINGNYTILALEPYRAFQTVMGTATNLSPLDRQGIEAIYPFPPFHGVAHLWHTPDFCDPQSSERGRIGHFVRYQNDGYSCSAASNKRNGSTSKVGDAPTSSTPDERGRDSEFPRSTSSPNSETLSTPAKPNRNLAFLRLL